MDTGSAVQRGVRWLDGLTQINVMGPAAWVKAGHTTLTYGLGYSASLCLLQIAGLKEKMRAENVISLPSVSHQVRVLT